MSTTEVVRNPGPGTRGRKVQITANFFEVKNLPNITIHHFDVTISPDVPPSTNRKVFSQFIDQFRVSDLQGARPVFDGRKNLFFPKAPPFDSRTFEIVLHEDARAKGTLTPSFKMKIKKVNEIHLSELSQFLQGQIPLTNNCLTAIMALDVLIHHEPAMLYQTIGRSFFTPHGSRPLSGGLDVWRGFHQSIRPAVGKMMVNLDVSATAFYQKGSLVEMIVKVLGLRTIDDLRRLSVPSLNRLERHIKGLRIQGTHRERSSRSFRILGLTKTAANDTLFSRHGQDGAAATDMIDVASYFKKAYNMTLSFPALPCVIVGKSAMLPLEVCTVVEGQRYPKKLDGSQTSDLIKFACLDPITRANNIKDGLRILSYAESDYLKDFGLKISNEMISIQARVLDPPKINYRTATGETGFLPMFIRELGITFEEMGMAVINKNPPIIYSGVNPETIEGSLKIAWVRAGDAVQLRPQLLVCVLPNIGVPLYAEIKRVADTILGVSTQCVQGKHIRTPKKQYCSNVCLKMNVKLGGVNSRLAVGSLPFLEEKVTIIFGADVTHPGPGEIDRPSVACLTASMDNKAGRFAAAIRIQPARQETITDLTDMAVELLRAFYASTNLTPERILFYRDGVAESQFAQVRRDEVAALKAAFKRLDKDYNPQLTFLVVQKRHHAKFFAMRAGMGDGKGNCQPGTVIDTEVVHPFEFNFYLQSHAGLLGTSRSAHYHVLHDEAGFSADDLQELTYRLCHLYARCTRAVSKVPSAYYAHLVAGRARFHLKGQNWSESGSTGAKTSSGEEGVTGDSTSSDKNGFGKVHGNLSKVMWFM
ncbi:eukaryotic translation initiation factor 2C [Entomortierella parvispora]|uniref:Eukaryotic translation initiation factor 2C n=1 Tax=Entomortierella parvispora TaxID=205924 RepID=A0A9P3HNF0_9FUNG|nr:eukaryotic translation initiation factor 2C [Entomortierella parvispora]